MQVAFRRLNANDQAFLWEALYHAIHVPSGNDPLPKEIVNDPLLSMYAANWAKRSGDFGLIAESDGIHIGAAWIRCWDRTAQGFGYIDIFTPELSMSVLPQFRGRGVGTRLLRRLIADCRGRHQQLSLSVSRSNPALRLYDREGFRVVSDEDPGSLTMVLDLAGLESGEPRMSQSPSHPLVRPRLSH